MDRTEAREHLRNMRNFLRHRKTDEQKAKLFAEFYRGTTWETTVAKYPKKTAAACVDLTIEALGEAIKALEQKENEDRPESVNECIPVYSERKTSRFWNRFLGRRHRRGGKEHVHHPR